MAPYRKFFFLLLILTLAIIQPIGAGAQEETEINTNGVQAHITQVDNSQFPSVTVYVSVTDGNGDPVAVRPSQIVLDEDGQRITPG